MRSYSLSYFVVLVLLFSCSQQAENTLFTALPASKTGIKFKNLVRESEEFNVLTYGPFYHGAGVAVGDINNDGLPDIYFTGNMMASKLYINQGNLKFKDITEQSGVAAAGLWNTGAETDSNPVVFAVKASLVAADALNQLVPLAEEAGFIVLFVIP